MTPALAAVARLSAIVAARMAASISFLNSISPPLRRRPAPLLTRKWRRGGDSSEARVAIWLPRLSAGNER